MNKTFLSQDQKTIVKSVLRNQYYAIGITEISPATVPHAITKCQNLNLQRQEVV